MTIWKFKLEITDCFKIEMPTGAQILSVQTQYGEPVLWALLDPDAPKIKRTFKIHGTGHPVSQNAKTEYKFIGTFQIQNGALVFHLFEVL